MSQRCGRVLGHLAAGLAVVAFAMSGAAVPSAHAAAGGRFGGGGHGGARTGGVLGRSSIVSPRTPAAHTGFGIGFQSGFSRQFHRGGARSSFRHQFRAPSRDFHPFRHRSPFFFNPGGFAYPPHYYYSPIPYYPTYPAYSIPYDSAYSGVNVAYPYPDPVVAYPQSDQGNVQIYTAPPEPPVLPRQPAPTLDQSSPPLPLDDGSLHFEVSPDEAKVFLDNRYLGEAHELRNIAEIIASAGRHLLEIRTDTERTFTEVVVSPHKVTPVRWLLAPSPVTPAGLSREDGRND